jgi:hypothetical protein
VDTVFTVVQEGTLVEHPDCFGSAAAASANAVENFYGWRVVNIPASFSYPAA